jgi:hypothetical protein
MENADFSKIKQGYSFLSKSLYNIMKDFNEKVEVVQTKEELKHVIGYMTQQASPIIEAIKRYGIEPPVHELNDEDIAKILKGGPTN